MGQDHFFQGHETGLAHLDEALQDRGHLDARKLTRLGLRVEQQHRNIERQPRDVGEGMGRIDGKRCEHRIDALGEQFVHLLALGVVELIPTHQFNSLGGELRQDLGAEDLGLFGHEFVGAGQDCIAQFTRHESGNGTHRHTGVNTTLQAGNSHHEEFVEIGTEDRQEPGTFQQRNTKLIAGLIEHAVVEGEPAQFPVGITIGWQGLFGEFRGAVSPVGLDGVKRWLGSLRHLGRMKPLGAMLIGGGGHAVTPVVGWSWWRAGLVGA